MIADIFFYFIGLENPLKVSKITVLGHIVQVLLHHKFGATPEIGPHFRDVNAAGAVRAVAKGGGRIWCGRSPLGGSLKKSTGSSSIIYKKKTSSCCEVPTHQPSIYITYFYVL